MSYRISKIEQNYSALDFSELQDDLNLAEAEDLDQRSYAIAKFKASGDRPDRIAKSDASEFGLRVAFWDVYAPVEGISAGQWKLEKDAVSGEEIIIRKESTLSGETK